MKRGFINKLRELSFSAINTPKTIYNNARSNPQKAKRIVKVSIALTTAVAFTLPKVFSHFHGQNPFLLGTIAIYLFPIKTVGGQLLGTIIGLSGILLGLAYANLSLFIAHHIQSSHDEHIHAPRRAFLWCALAVGAFGCGYVRSKIARSYLGINFFMLVNMFALIRGINNLGYQFHVFFYVMLFGACVSLFISIVFWPEDRGGVLKRDTVKGLCEMKAMVVALRQVMRYGACDEAETAGIRAAENALGASLHEANYEISFSRVESSYLVPLNRCMSRLISTCRVFNASMRRKQLLRTQRPLGRCSLDLNSIHTRIAMDGTFGIALELLDTMVIRVEELYKGNVSSKVNHEKFEKSIEDLCGFIKADCYTRVIDGYRDLEDAACTDQVNTTVLDVLDVVKDMARAIKIIEPSRLRLVLPRKLNRREFEMSEPQNSGQSDGISRFDAMSRGRSMMPSDEAYLLFMDSTTPTHRMCIWISEKIIALQNSRHVKYAIKLMVVMGILAMPAFISKWYIWYDHMRAQLAMISALVAMETTRGMTFRTAGMKLTGAILGASLAFIVLEVSRSIIPVEIALTSVVGLLIGYLVNHPIWTKSGTVCALAYNLILGVATVFPEQGPVTYVFARRLLTLPVGLLVAAFVHITLFPYHARQELVKGLGSSLDWLHHLLFAIEASEEHPSLQAKFDAMVQKAHNHAGFAKSLLPATHYEVSLGGHWPYKRFERIVDKIFDVVDIIVGDIPADPILAFHLHSTRACENVRAKLLASLCNDLLVVSHTLSARLFLPRHDSISTSVLQEYILELLAQAQVPASPRSYNDVGRLADLVNEMNYLRQEVDELTTETQCPKNGLLPHLSFVIRKSRPGTPSTPRGRRSRAPSVVEFMIGEPDEMGPDVRGDENV
ncbi:hypothetical protein BDD12DRAFT_871658 [Trichophaea hybrida]|nr:hypothetical protein BDD12DRAFT_871658 [Trichophaea hybrida]